MGLEGIFDAWEQRKLGDVATSFEYGLNASSKEYDGENKYIRITDINENSHLFNQNNLTSPDIVLINSDNYLLKEGDILFARTGASVGKSYCYEEIDGKVYYAGFLIRAKVKQKYDVKFIFQNTLTNRYNNFIQITSQRSGQPGINAQEYANFDLHTPKLEEQQKIGTFFKQLDNTIALHQRKLDTLKLMKKGFLQQMFPEKGEKVPKLRFADFEEEWEQRKLGEYGEFYYGKSAPKWSVTEDAVIPCVRYGELYTKFGAKIDRIYSYTNIPKENLKFSTGYEVLVPRVGENPLEFAKCSWLKIPNVAIGEMISVYNTKQNPLFIAIYFRAKMRIEFAKRVEGGNVSNLYYSYLENILLSIPSIGEQVRIAKIFSKLDDIINLQQNKIDKFKNLKKSYLQNMFI
ncbi:restriction endonuclease subunit S [Listeria ivanovii]|uniref:restriction endonuclease subunit S n=1 Tax=Listeria ivanovii TaxID=1638 RepID=UPI0019046DC6|nr:restriction endonuclease subunit S [Listeria ivanovii]MBK1984364.1 restriction endonuclease subunit S [Listeria ivanovii subsp. londoniensis]